MKVGIWEVEFVHLDFREMRPLFNTSKKEILETAMKLKENSEN